MVLLLNRKLPDNAVKLLESMDRGYGRSAGGDQALRQPGRAASAQQGPPRLPANAPAIVNSAPKSAGKQAGIRQECLCGMSCHSTCQEARALRPCQATRSLSEASQSTSIEGCAGPQRPLLRTAMQNTCSASRTADCLREGHASESRGKAAEGPRPRDRNRCLGPRAADIGGLHRDVRQGACNTTGSLDCSCRLVGATLIDLQAARLPHTCTDTPRGWQWHPIECQVATGKSCLSS